MIDLGQPCTEDRACTLPNHLCGYPDCIRGRQEKAVKAAKVVAAGYGYTRHELRTASLDFMFEYALRMQEALSYYARACQEDDPEFDRMRMVAQGDVDLGRVTELFAADCGDRARTALKRES